MVQTVIDTLKHFLSPEIIIFIISLLPILELRGGLIAASLLGIPWLKASIICVIANFIPIPFIILFIEKILDYLSVKGPIKKFAKAITEKGRRKGKELTEKYPNSVLLGIYLFVAIPLPGTGAWTGALIAALLGLPPKKCILPIGLGILTACCIMLSLTYLLPGVFGF
ncbi:COG2426 family protein [Enterococcus cecorum]|uniref:COG2426 family protein n=1 Tax=Enterococcus cecorum TaxID=44008 RepID=UPI00148C5166|nr:small multi-drug export protein [Enterococcus cecorum]